MEQEYRAELETALEAAHRAGTLLEEMYHAFEVIPDAPIDISTEADRASQETILTAIRERYPEDSLCAEEETATLGAAPQGSSRIWVVDPIDGTRGFARKTGEFSVMIGLLVDGEIVLGVVHEPIPGRLTYALRGAGCWRNDRGDAQPQSCSVTAQSELGAATLVQSHSRGHNPSLPVRLLRPARVRETYSAGIKLGMVARGEVDLYVNTYREFHDWDICAGHILVTEAGGQVTGILGHGLRYALPGALQRHGLLATNGPLHQPAVKILCSEPRLMA